MALDANIAMGVRPAQIENPMNQMAQMMQLRQAQQGFEEQNALKQALAQGADINDKATFNRIAGINPRLAMELRSKEIETQQKQTEIGLKRADYLGAAYGTLVKNPTLDTARSIFDNAISMGVFTPQQAAQLFAKLEKNPGQIATLAQQGVDAAISAKEKMSDATSRRNADVGAAAPMMNARLAQKQFDLDQADSARISNILQGGPSTAPVATATPPMMAGGGGGGGAAPITSVGPAPMSTAPVTAPATGVVAQPNVLATQVAPPAEPNVNALNPNAPKPNTLDQISALIRIGKPKAIQAADALIKQYNLENTVGKVERDANGSLVLINDRTGSSKVVTGADGKPLPSGVAPVWNEKAQVFITAPTPGSPSAKVTEVPELRQIAKKRSATETLDIAGFNKTTGTNEISDLIKQSTSGLAENALAKTAGALFGKGTAGAEAIATLETRANELTLGLAPNGSLGAGFSNDDRTFMLAKLGDVANANKPMNVRLAAWEDVMKRAARNAGVDYKGTGAAGATPSNSARNYSAQEQQALEWAKSNPSDPRAAQIRQRLGVQ